MGTPHAWTHENRFPRRAWEPDRFWNWVSLPRSAWECVRCASRDSHAEHGNQTGFEFGSRPSLCVGVCTVCPQGLPRGTWEPDRFWNWTSLPRSAWECGRYARRGSHAEHGNQIDSGVGSRPLALHGSVYGMPAGVPTRSMGTRQFQDLMFLDLTPSLGVGVCKACPQGFPRGAWEPVTATKNGVRRPRSCCA